MPWTKSGPGDFQFGILPRIVFLLSLVISNSFCFVTSTSLCKSFNHFLSLLWSTESFHMSIPFRFFSIWLIIVRSLSFLIQFLTKLLLIILKQTVLSKPIYLSQWYLLTFAAIATILCFNSSVTTPIVLTLRLYFLSNVCQCLRLLTYPLMIPTDLSPSSVL